MATTNLQYMHYGCGSTPYVMEMSQADLEAEAATVAFEAEAAMEALGTEAEIMAALEARDAAKRKRPAQRVNTPLAVEQHYSPREVAERLGLSSHFVRDYFKDSTDILVIDRPERRFKRGYTTMRISESAVQRMIASLRSRSR